MVTVGARVDDYAVPAAPPSGTVAWPGGGVGLEALRPAVAEREGSDSRVLFVTTCEVSWL